MNGDSQPSPAANYQDAVKARYARAVAQHGDHVRSLLYHSEQSQLDRFEAISRIASFAGTSVLDVGCGRADLADFLRARHGDLSYTGIEITPELADIARRRAPGLTIVRGTIHDLPSDAAYDYVIESGVFSTTEYTWPIVESTLRSMWKHTRRTMIATFLSDLSSGTPSTESRYFSHANLSRFAESLTRRFSLHHDYRDNDFMLLMHREEEPRGTESFPRRIPADLVLRPELPH